jgi:membrane protein implicated in regulation of membrane protease activity
VETGKWTLGPFTLTARDHVLGSLLISFRAAHWTLRLWFAIIALVLAVGGALALHAGEWVLGAFLLLVLMFSFVLGPALRGLRKSNRDAVAQLDEEGYVADGPRARMLVRWDGIRSSHYVGGFLVVMISRQTGLVVPPHAAPAERIEAFARELERRRAAAAAA